MGQPNGHQMCGYQTRGIKRGGIKRVGIKRGAVEIFVTFTESEKLYSNCKI